MRVLVCMAPPHNPMPSAGSIAACRATMRTLCRNVRALAASMSDSSSSTSNSRSAGRSLPPISPSAGNAASRPLPALRGWGAPRLLCSPPPLCPATRMRHALSRRFVAGGEGVGQVAIVQHGSVGAVGLLDLVERLRDQTPLDAVTGHEGECGLEKIQPPKRRKLVKHQHQTMPAVF